ncbi:MAG: dockerin type I domain-containing protein [Ruminococcus sp.]|nr:dockerin type I domain-containing protein [Ruminococcus sp.]
MKKIVSKCISLCLVIALCVGVFPFIQYSAKAAVIGDVDKDGSLTINDASCLQGYLAKIYSADSLDLTVADISGDGRVTIFDVAEMMIRLANPSLYNPLYGKKIANFGDSVGAGDGAGGYGYAQFLRYRNRMKLTEKAKGGCNLAVTDARDDDICNTVKSIEGDFDYILVEGGYNDVFRKLTIGEVSDSKDIEDFDETTVCGAVESICYTLTNKFSSAKKLFVLGHKKEGIYEQQQALVWSAIKTVLDKWEIPYVDITEETGFTSSTYEGDGVLFNRNDGTHPTKYGYEKYYVPVIESKLMQL